MALSSRVFNRIDGNRRPHDVPPHVNQNVKGLDGEAAGQASVAAKSSGSRKNLTCAAGVNEIDVSDGLGWPSSSSTRQPSFLHVQEHPSLLVVLPSSHCRAP